MVKDQLKLEKRAYLEYLVSLLRRRAHNFYLPFAGIEELEHEINKVDAHLTSLEICIKSCPTTNYHLN